jgi:hypothetical protein
MLRAYSILGLILALILADYTMQVTNHGDKAVVRRFNNLRLQHSKQLPA